MSLTSCKIIPAFIVSYRSHVCSRMHQQNESSADLLVEKPPTFIVDRDPSQRRVVVVTDFPDIDRGHILTYDPEFGGAHGPPMWVKQYTDRPVFNPYTVKHLINRRKWCR
eukprot:GHVU01055037.1.p2 GENE.GHVU01055037.1~~GHVU01055037.1.p2  ORF type:complete len:110 (+),score=6.47 GHVU01055037.1:262-591(+)